MKQKPSLIIKDPYVSDTALLEAFHEWAAGHERRAEERRIPQNDRREISGRRAGDMRVDLYGNLIKD